MEVCNNPELESFRVLWVRKFVEIKTEGKIGRGENMKVCPLGELGTHMAGKSLSGIMK